ncbi:MAG: ABC transporter ATP-binding protein [Solirubrobacteraceae bacterium]|nr:MAG: ABC transporter [Solirubrobacterales bacterium]
MRTAHVLSLERFTYTYPDASAPALTELSMTLEDGQFVVVAGLSGSGKSTLLRAACGLIPHFHGGEASGSLLVGGLDVRDHGPGVLADMVGTLLQDPESQVVMNTVRAELAFGLENRGYPSGPTARAVEEVALALGIDALLDRPTAELSGGELQRVALGAALAGRPRLLVLDEPTSQLDPVAGAELLGLLRRINEEWGTAVLLCEQRLERCLAAADRVLVLQDGRLAHDGTPEHFLNWAADHAATLVTPAAALFGAAGLTPLPVDVKRARQILRTRGLLPDVAVALGQGRPRRLRRRKHAPGPEAALELSAVWHEWPNGRSALRGVSLTLAPGERVALMGRNGAGKSTLLRQAAGIIAPTRGSVRASGRVALLLQNPGDYLIHDRVEEEVGRDELRRGGLSALGARHPRDLSGGERQRLALALVLAAGEGPPAVLLLDEPTRGMDHARRQELVAELAAVAANGTAVLVATHDPELAAACADRVVLLGDGRPVADGPVRDVLAGGLYFATETARVLGGAGGALLPAEGGELVRGLVAARSADMPALRPPSEVAALP